MPPVLRASWDRVMDEHGALRRSCPYCGAADARRLGDCSVCDRVVCEQCGNVQIAMGARTVTHHECLKKSSSGFKMIRFVD